MLHCSFEVFIFSDLALAFQRFTCWHFLQM